MMNVFGPVPSRRFGRSLGINNIPPKKCTYSCVYCQLGRTLEMTIERKPFFNPENILNEVKAKVKKVKNNGEDVDYLAFVPDGEPTLDSNFGTMISLLKQVGIRIAVITNSSLIWRKDVREDLMKADLVSVKIDAFDESEWKKINRPYGMLEYDKILEGILKFSGEYQGKLLTETMLVRGLNDDRKSVEETANFIKKVKPEISSSVFG